MSVTCKKCGRELSPDGKDGVLIIRKDEIRITREPGKITTLCDDKVSGTYCWPCANSLEKPKP